MSVGILHDNFSPLGIVTTTDATPTALVSHDFTNDSACQVNIRVVCRDINTGNAKGWHWEAVAKRVGGNNAVAAGAVLKLLDGVGDVALALASMAVSVTGGNVNVTVTGIAGTTLEWWGEFSALCIEQAG